LKNYYFTVPSKETNWNYIHTSTKNVQSNVINALTKSSISITVSSANNQSRMMTIVYQHSGMCYEVYAIHRCCLEGCNFHSPYSHCHCTMWLSFQLRLCIGATKMMF